MLFRFGTLAALFAFAIYWVSIRLGPEDPILYEKLTSESHELRTRRAFEEEPAFQKRQKVQKDIWTQNETHHLTLLSEESKLIISQEKDKIEATEILRKIECKTPNELTFNAEAGIYNFPSHQFTLQDQCKLKLGDNQIEGTRIHFDFLDETVTYENPHGKMPQEKIDFTAKILFWDKNKDQLHLHDEVTIKQAEDLTLLSDNGTVFFDNLHPKKVVLEGKVRLISSRIQNKESFAMADELQYDLNEETLHFSADKRVLFWQDGFMLSAKEILIRKDQTVMGQGDVHFTFNLEEQNTIDQFFKQYL